MSPAQIIVCDGSITANVSNSACIELDTVIPAAHTSDFTSTMVRGYYFQAQSSFTISYLRASDGNSAGATANSQSVAVVDYGTTMPAMYPAATGSHTTLFSAVDAGTGWISCNINIVAGNYYAILGAKHNSGSTQMYNSYGPASPTIVIDGIPTVVNRVVLQSTIPVGGPVSGSVMANNTSSIGRVDFIAGFVNPNSVFYSWSTGDTTQSVSNLCPGTYSVTVTDCQGCVDSSTVTIGTAIVSGCTDSTASNFDPCAVIDDGSCLTACPSGVGANSESFEDPTVPINAQGPWANWTYDAASSTFTGTNGWRKDDLGTSSLNTGPLNGAPSFDGSYYLYCETSGQSNMTANLVSACVDLNNFVDPSFAFAYHMYGATMGTLNVDVSNDGGATWTNLWTESGDQGTNWLEAGISLSNYAGQIVQLRMSYTSGTSFTGDCAIDYLRFIDGLNIGCMDSTACNYDSTATITATCDYTCLGCTDPLATNFDSTATVDDGSCTYPCTPYINGVSAVVDFDASCFGSSDGQASVIVSSSNGNDYYLWSNGATTSSVSGLSAGTYTCTVTDSVFGCVATVSVTISEPAQISVSGTTIDAMPGQNNGQASITISGGTPCYVGSPILITEYDPGAPDALEIQNVTGSDIDVTGWTVHVSGSYTDINNTNTTVQTLSGIMSAGATQYWTDATTNNYWGSNLFWNPGAATSFRGWIMIKDASGTVMDVFVANWTATEIATSTVGLAGMWVGDGWDQTSVPAGNSASRVSAGNDATAFVNVVSTLGATNAGLTLPFSSSGAYSYSWTNGDTTQNITGLPLGPIGVTVTDCNGCTGNWMGFILTNTLPGCTDPTAFNYNPLANLDDSSCVPFIYGCIDSLNVVSGFPNVNYNPLANTDDGSCTDTLLGCTDSLAPNYNMYANVDDGSCILPCASGIGANQDGFETATAIYQQGPWTHWTYDVSSSTFTLTNGWRSLSGATGSGSTGPSGPAEGSYYLYCETSGQYNQTANLVSECVDLSSLSSPTFVASYHMWGATMGTLNIDISTDGEYTWSTIWTESGDQGNQWYDAVIDLSNYAGQIVQIRMSYTSGTSFTGDCAIDNLRFMEAPMSGCTDPLACNYDTAATIDDGSCYVLTGTVSTNDISCNGLTDGSATVSANASIVSYAWSNGDSTATATGLAAGTYTCVITDANGCTDNVSATIVEPSGMTLSMLVGNESTPGAFDGQIDLSASGGVACIVNDSLSTHNTAHSSNGSSGVHFNIINNSTSPLTINGFSQGSYSYSGVNNMNVYYMPAPYVVTPTGWTQVATAVPVTIPVGGTFATPVYSTTIPITPVTIPAGSTYGFYVGGTSTVSYATATASGPVGSVVASNALMSVTSGVGGTFGSGTFSPRAPVVQVHYGDPGATPYTYLWSTGDTTEDITGLTSSQYCVTVTDCNGCQASLCDSVGISATLGCTDPTAMNYNSFANQDDGSCMYDCAVFAISLDSTGNVTGCNGGSNGYVAASINMSGSVTWLDNGSTTANRNNMSAGTYSLVAVTPDGMCYDTLTITITEPSTISLSMAIGNESSPGAGDGQIDLTATGGVPCATSVQVGSGTVASYMSYLWYTYYMDGHTEITYPAAELAALGMNPGDVMDELGWKIITLGSGTTMNNAQMTVNGVVVYSGNYTPVAGMNNFVFSTPVTYTGGDLVVTWCFDNSAYVSGNNLFESTLIGGTLSNYSDLLHLQDVLRLFLL